MTTHLLRICPVCKKGFDVALKNGSRNYKPITCSEECNSLAKEIRKDTPDEWEKMVKEAEDAFRDPARSCIMYDPKAKCCTGLTALWCTVETCKFYKPKVKEETE